MKQKRHSDAVEAGQLGSSSGQTSDCVSPDRANKIRRIKHRECKKGHPGWGWPASPPNGRKRGFVLLADLLLSHVGPMSLTLQRLMNIHGFLSRTVCTVVHPAMITRQIVYDVLVYGLGLRRYDDSRVAAMRGPFNLDSAGRNHDSIDPLLREMLLGTLNSTLPRVAVEILLNLPGSIAGRFGSGLLDGRANPAGQGLTFRQGSAGEYEKGRDEDSDEPGFHDRLLLGSDGFCQASRFRF